MSTRGERNCNPGNIDFEPANHWQGQTGIETLTPAELAAGETPRFAAFTAPLWGIRALCVLLLAYQRKHGDATVRQIITRWAPGSENNTAAYIADVAKRMAGDSPEPIDPDAPIDLTDLDDLALLAEAIIAHENGQQPYPVALVDEAAKLALA